MPSGASCSPPFCWLSWCCCGPLQTARGQSQSGAGADPGAQPHFCYFKLPVVVFHFCFCFLSGSPIHLWLTKTMKRKRSKSPCWMKLLVRLNILLLSIVTPAKGYPIITYDWALLRQTVLKIQVDGGWAVAIVQFRWSDNQRNIVYCFIDTVCQYLNLLL